MSFWIPFEGGISQVPVRLCNSVPFKDRREVKEGFVGNHSLFFLGRLYGWSRHHFSLQFWCIFLPVLTPYDTWFLWFCENCDFTLHRLLRPRQVFHQQISNQCSSAAYCCSQSRSSAWNEFLSPGYYVAWTRCVWVCNTAGSQDVRRHSSLEGSADRAHTWPRGPGPTAVPHKNSRPKAAGTVIRFKASHPPCKHH